MRSMLWLGCAALVCAAGFLFLAADFASRHPDSMAVRCVQAAHTMTERCNPIRMLASAGVHAFRTASEMVWKAMTVANESPKTTCASSTCTAHTQASCAMAQPPEVIDLTLLPDPYVKAEGEEQETEAPDIYAPPAADEPEVLSTPPATIEEDQDDLSTMPPASDDDGEEAPATPTCGQPDSDQEPTPPPMEDLIREQLEATRQHVFELWFDLFQKSCETADEPPTAEACEGGADTEKEPAAEASSDEEDNKVRYVPLEKVIEESAQSDEVPETKDEGSQEESDTVPMDKPADCQMDPKYHQQYPGCPYLGGDPASHHCSPSMTNPTPAPKHHKKKVKASPIIDPKPDAEEAEVPPADVMVPFPMNRQPSAARPQNLGPTPNEESPHHPEVDTMEFRKSDAKEGEFDSRPF